MDPLLRRNSVVGGEVWPFRAATDRYVPVRAERRTVKTRQSVAVSLSAQGSSATSVSRRARHRGYCVRGHLKGVESGELPSLLWATAQRTIISFVASTAPTRRCRSH